MNNQELIEAIKVLYPDLTNQEIYDRIHKNMDRDDCRKRLAELEAFVAKNIP